MPARPEITNWPEWETERRILLAQLDQVGGKIATAIEDASFLQKAAGNEISDHVLCDERDKIDDAIRAAGFALTCLRHRFKRLLIIKAELWLAEQQALLKGLDVSAPKLKGGLD